MGLRARVHALFQVLLREHREPGRMALAVLVGCMVGCTPLFGLHLPLCVALALLLRLNKLVVYGAANLSVPPLVPVLAFLSVQLGELLLSGRWPGLRLDEFRREPPWTLAKRFFSAWMVGGAALGAAIGVVAGGIVYVVLRRRRGRPAAPADAIGEAIARAGRRYRAARPWLRDYARMKYRLDPCYRAVAERVPAGALLVDLGTGLGMLPVLLGELGAGRRAIGVEWDASKARAGQAAAAGLAGVEIVQGDLRGFALPPCDAVTLVDVLHYYEPAAQRAILAAAAAALRPGGALLVREADGAQRGGARWTRLLEALAVRLRWNRGPMVHFRPAAELEADLHALGLGVERAEVAGRLHPGNVLIVGRRGAGDIGGR